MLLLQIKNVNYRCFIHNFRKSEANNLFKTYFPKDRGYIWKIFSKFLVYSRYSNFFYFSIYNMVDCEYSIGICKSLKNSVETIMGNPEILKFVTDNL